MLGSRPLKRRFQTQCSVKIRVCVGVLEQKSPPVPPSHRGSNQLFCDQRSLIRPEFPELLQGL